MFNQIQSTLFGFTHKAKENTSAFVISAALGQFLHLCVFTHAARV